MLLGLIQRIESQQPQGNRIHRQDKSVFISDDQPVRHAILNREKLLLTEHHRGHQIFLRTLGSNSLGNIGLNADIVCGFPFRIPHRRNRNFVPKGVAVLVIV